MSIRRERDARRVAKSVRSHEATMAAYGRGWEKRTGFSREQVGKAFDRSEPSLTHSHYIKPLNPGKGHVKLPGAEDYDGSVRDMGVTGILKDYNPQGKG